MLRKTKDERCCLCGMPCPDKFGFDAAEWDWFTGYFDQTVHFCLYCRRKRPDVRDRLLRMSRTMPAAPERLHSLDRALRHRR